MKVFKKAERRAARRIQNHMAYWLGFLTMVGGSGACSGPRTVDAMQSAQAPNKKKQAQNKGTGKELELESMDEKTCSIAVLGEAQQTKKGDWIAATLPLELAGVNLKSTKTRIFYHCGTTFEAKHCKKKKYQVPASDISCLSTVPTLKTFPDWVPGSGSHLSTFLQRDENDLTKGCLEVRYQPMANQPALYVVAYMVLNNGKVRLRIFTIRAQDKKQLVDQLKTHSNMVPSSVSLVNNSTHQSTQSSSINDVVPLKQTHNGSHQVQQQALQQLHLGNNTSGARRKFSTNNSSHVEQQQIVHVTTSQMANAAITNAPINNALANNNEDNEHKEHSTEAPAMATNNEQAMITATDMMQLDEEDDELLEHAASPQVLWTEATSMRPSWAKKGKKEGSFFSLEAIPYLPFAAVRKKAGGVTYDWYAEEDEAKQAIGVKAISNKGSLLLALVPFQQLPGGIGKCGKVTPSQQGSFLKTCMKELGDGYNDEMVAVHGFYEHDEAANCAGYLVIWLKREGHLPLKIIVDLTTAQTATNTTG